MTFGRRELLLLMLLAAAVEWMVQGWSERASGDRAYMTTPRTRNTSQLEHGNTALCATRNITPGAQMDWLDQFLIGDHDSLPIAELEHTVLVAHDFGTQIAYRSQPGHLI